MGYDIHITRKENWFDEEGEEISAAEWLTYVASDPELRLDGFADARLENGLVLRAVDPGMTVWIGHSEHGKRSGSAWLWLSRGSVQAKNPDEETLQKMWRIAQSLGARVQGDECELYDSNGSVIRGEEARRNADAPRKPSWRFGHDEQATGAASLQDERDA